MPPLSDKYDVVIVGAGPAGSSAAIRLSCAGLSVLLVEQTTFPREKLCGEFISPECLGHFTELGIKPELALAGGNELFETVFFSRSGKSVSVQSEWFGNASSRALGLSRASMDDLLVNRARTAGVDVLMETAATGLIFHEENVIGVKLKEKGGDERHVRAGLMLDATGRRCALARVVTKRTEMKAAKFVAFKTHLRAASVPDGVCEIYSYRGGYGGCNPVENGLFNLCFIASSADAKRFGNDTESLMREIVFSNKRAKASLRHAEVVKAWHAVPIERFGRGELVPVHGLITIGDAAAFIDPFTGSGILLALESARIAAKAIVNNFQAGGSFDELADAYKRGYSVAFDRRLRVCSLLRHVSFAPFWADAVISVLSLSTGLRRRVARSTRFSGESAV